MSQDEAQSVPERSVQRVLAALVQKWRASANGHTRRGNGYRPGYRDLAVRALAQAETLRLCADELEKEIAANAAGQRRHE